MARILFTVLPLTGHLNPALAVADVLSARGHEVAWAVHADEIGAKLPGAARVYPLDDHRFKPKKTVAQVRGLESVRLFFADYAMPLAAHALEPLEAAVRDFGPDVIASDHQMSAGGLVARKLGLPWVSLVTTTAALMKMSAPLKDWVAAQYEMLQQSYLPVPLRREFPDFSQHGVVVFSIDALAGEPRSRYAVPCQFVGPVRGEGRQDIEFPWDWLQADSRKILVTLGTVSRDLDRRFFEVSMEAIADLSWLQAVIVAPRALAEQAPPNVLVREYVPQLPLLQHMDGVVCHAGHNTVSEALLCGLPLIVSPIRDDQPLIARQVVENGAALFLRHGKVTPASMRGAIEALLETPSLREQAQRLQNELRTTPGAGAAADILLAAAADPASTISRVA